MPQPQPQPLPFAPVTQPWLQAAARGVTWLEETLDIEGSLPGSLHDLGSYYKWPLALATLGRMPQAKALFETVVDNFLTSDGDFRSSVEKSADPLYGQISDTYTNTWPIIAARILGRDDVALPALDCLRERHVPHTGGYLTGMPGQYADERQDIVTIAGCGNALLAWDAVEEAAGAGDCLLRIIAQQGPAELPFYLYIDGKGELQRQDLGIPEVLTRIDPSQPGQVYVYWGMAAVFLARLFAVTNQQRFLDGARAYFARHEACGDVVFDGLGCCKTGWAAATLYRLTGESVFRDVVLRVAAELVAAQCDDGSWSRPQLSPQLNCDCTGEIVYHLSQYTLELSSGSTV
jgi:hypothetical protein